MGIWIVIAVAAILNSAPLDIIDAKWGIDPCLWHAWYPFARDIQIFGFALLAFIVCPYKRVELKVATFFFCLWKVAAFAINIFDKGTTWSAWAIIAMTAIYLTWLLRAGIMGAFKQEEPKNGAYVFYMPIHSVWGLLKALFFPWYGMRYESVVLVQGDMLWHVRNKRFETHRVEDTNLLSREGVRVYLGRNLTGYEEMRLYKLVGKRAVPGLRDCRKLRI